MFINYDCPTCGVIRGFKAHNACINCGTTDLIETDLLTPEEEVRALEAKERETRLIPGTQLAPGDKLNGGVLNGKNARWEKKMTEMMDTQGMTNLKSGRHESEPYVPAYKGDPMAPSYGDGTVAQALGINPNMKAVDAAKMLQATTGMTSVVRDKESGQYMNPVASTLAALKGKGPRQGKYRPEAKS